MILPLPQDPVFIVGYPRSGTTLLQRFLVTQPGFYSFPETHYFSVVERSIRLAGDERIAPADLGALQQAITEKTEQRFTAHEINLLAREAKAEALTSKQLFEFIVSRFLLPQVGTGGAGAPWRWVEKTPTHANFLERIIQLYPQVQILHIVRHPVPAILSRRQKFPFNRETPLDRLARAWNRLLENAEQSRKKHPERMHTLRYEDMVGDPEKTLGAVGAFLGVPFDLAKIGGIRSAALPAPLVLSSEKWKLEDMQLERVNTNDSYREEAVKSDVELIESIVCEKMAHYGYGHFE